MRHPRTAPSAHRLTATALLLFALPSLTGCALLGVTPNGVSVAAQAAGRHLKSVPLDGTVLKKLSTTYSVERQALEKAAPLVETQPVWKAQLSKINETADAVDDTEPAGIGVDVACDALDGEVRTGMDITVSVMKSVGFGTPQLKVTALIESMQGLYAQLKKTLDTGDEQQKSAVALMCSTYSVLPAK